MKIAVGIDVSKSTLDVAVLEPGGKTAQFQVPNTPAGHGALLDRARKAARPAGSALHFCMEVTASYHHGLALFLVEAGELVSVENPRRVRHFAVADGQVHKTDRADAKGIARYALAMEPPPWRLSEPHLRELVALDRRVTELKAMRNQETNRLEAPCLPRLVEEGVAASVGAFDAQVLLLEGRIEEILSENEVLAAQVELLESVPGIARRSAVGLLAEAGDLAAYETAQDLAARLGLNPVQRRSGTSLNGRSRISKAGNAHARSRMYMPTVVAIRVNPPVRAFYERLVAAHKPKKSALLAAERKLVMVCYGVLKSGKPFDPHHDPKKEAAPKEKGLTP
ncbi:IS110 family transposase [bacterium]|nr:MAG: IS110 family transposase [bacterium]